MGKSRRHSGLMLKSVEQILKSDSLTDFQVLISPIDSASILTDVIQHLRQLGYQGSAQIFGVESPANNPNLHIELASSDTTTSESITNVLTDSHLPFPASIYIEQDTNGNIQALVNVVAQLRDPDGGCPWDLEQTPKTLTKYILEEAYETVEAIQSGDIAAIADELGDLLLQVVLQAQIAQENQSFSLTTVSQGITDKLIRRHPHVFGDVQVNTVDDVRANWEAIKATEKGIDPNDHHQLSRKMIREAKTLPPIMSGLKLAKRAADAGLEWPDLAGVWAKFYEELAEFQEALLIGREQEQLAELGDLLFTLINVARWCKLDPSDALQLTNHKLIQRVQLIEEQADKPLTDYSLEELDDLWNQAKAKLKDQHNQASNPQSS